jgi:diguanylate cyclase (GGDEF)-like protein
MPIKILFIDDDPDLRGDISAIMRDSGYEVLEADNGAEGIEIVKAHRPNLILCDINMPGMSGHEVLRHLRECHPEHAGIPFIFLSANNDKSNILAGLELGADEYLTKPVDLDLLLAKLKACSRIRNVYDKHLRLQVNYDSLTGLPNRTLALDRISGFIDNIDRKNSSLFVFCVGLNNFKQVNDAFGQTAGDRMLMEFGQRLAKNIHEFDSFATVACQNGAEFLIAITLPRSGTSSEVILSLIYQSFSSPLPHYEYDIHQTVSIGISELNEERGVAESLVNEASIAMSRARESKGTSYRVFCPNMAKTATMKLELEDKLHHALERDEFFLVYQPLIDVRTGMPVGAEALLRWQNPQLGNTPPDQFIPVAEMTGAILPIGIWVMETACRQAQAWWEQSGVSLRMSVNISPRQLEDLEFVNKISNILTESGLPANCLEMEVTERMLLEDTEQAALMMDELHSINIRLSVDDFGTGYSSLGLLKRFPFDTLKLDRGFISNVTTDPKDASLVSSIIEMAHGMGLDVIAEGVETKEQLEFLQRHNCDMVQGYYFGKPMLSDDFYEWWEAWNEDVSVKITNSLILAS